MRRAETEEHVGQLIEVAQVVLGNVAIFDTDRSLSGQDGETFLDAEGARQAATFSGQVAGALFDNDSDVSSVYVFSNAISVKRSSEWTAAQADDAADLIRKFLVYYEENRA